MEKPDTHQARATSSVGAVPGGVSEAMVLFANWMFVPMPFQIPFVSAFSSGIDRKSTRLNSSHSSISYAVFCLKKKIINPYKPLCRDLGLSRCCMHKHRRLRKTLEHEVVK